MKFIEIYLTILILFLTISANAQKDWTISANISPAITKPNKNNNLFKFVLSYTVGINSLYFIDKQMFIKTGINYKQKKSLINDIPDTRSLYDTNGNINPDNIQYFDYKESYHYFNLPILFNYRVSKEEKTSIFFSGGIEFSYLFKIVYVLDFNDRKQKTTLKNKEIDNNFVSSINFGVGLYQPLSSKLILLLKPVYTYDFYAGKNNSGVKFHSFGLNAEIHYRLK